MSVSGVEGSEATRDTRHPTLIPTAGRFALGNRLGFSQRRTRDDRRLLRTESWPRRTARGPEGSARVRPSRRLAPVLDLAPEPRALVPDRPGLVLQNAGPPTVIVAHRVVGAGVVGDSVEPVGLQRPRHRARAAQRPARRFDALAHPVEDRPGGFDRAADDAGARGPRLRSSRDGGAARARARPRWPASPGPPGRADPPRPAPRRRARPRSGRWRPRNPARTARGRA